MELLAVENGDGRMALMSLLASAIGGAVVWGTGQLWKWHDERKKREDGAEKSVNEHLQKLIERIDREKTETDKENAALNKRVGRLSVRTTALLSHVRYLEHVLQNNKLTFERYEEPPDPEGSDTAAHAPVSGSGISPQDET